MTSAETTPRRLAAPPLPSGGTAPRVLRRMRAAGAGLPPGDGVAAFHQVYLSVTEELWRRLERGGVFADPPATAELADKFAGRYLAALEAEQAAGRRPPACWRPLFQLRHHPAVRPLQFALAGVNAHVGHDLALALVDTCRSRRAAPGELAGDFDRVGGMLTDLEERVREELMPGPDVLELAEPLTHLAGSWSLEKAREGAWATFRALWGLRTFGELTEEFTARLDAGVGLVSRVLLTPLPR